MTWKKETNIKFNDNIIRIYKNESEYTTINVGEGNKVESADISNGHIQVIFSEGGLKRLRRYSTEDFFI